jgi:hydroxymethylbilane synthase
LDHAPSRASVNAERAVLASPGGGCQVPIGAYARIQGATLFLIAVVISPDGREFVHETGQGNLPDAEAIGRGVGAALLQHGGREILDRVYAT